jgi:hypothetical protein
MRTLHWFLASLTLALALLTRGAAAQVGAPAGPSAPEPLPERAGEADQATTGTSFDPQLVAGIATWAVGMGFVVVFNYAFFHVRDLTGDDTLVEYRKGIPNDQSSCDRARQGVVSARAGAAAPSDVAALCDRIDSTLLLRNVTLPIGLVASVLGTVLIGTSDTVVGTEQARSWDVQIHLARDQGALQIEGRF